MRVTRSIAILRIDSNNQNEMKVGFYSFNQDHKNSFHSSLENGTFDNDNDNYNSDRWIMLIMHNQSFPFKDSLSRHFSIVPYQTESIVFLLFIPHLAIIHPYIAESSDHHQIDHSYSPDRSHQEWLNHIGLDHFHILGDFDI